MSTIGNELLRYESLIAQNEESLAESLVAAEEKNATIPANSKLHDLPAIIRSITGGGEDPGTGTILVRFLDYDGSVIGERRTNYGGSITPPPDPVHEGLTFQGWNYDSADFQSITGDLDVGALYVTVSGKTEIDVEIRPYTGTTRIVGITIINTGGTATIAWGDGGSSRIEYEAPNGVYVQHTYSSYGSYTISVSSTGEYGLGTRYGGSLIGSEETPDKKVIRVRIGDLKTTDQSGSAIYFNLSFCEALQSISMGKDFSSNKINCYNCKSLTGLVYSAVASVGGIMALLNCVSLRNVSISPGAESTGPMCRNCPAIQRVVVPAKATDVSFPFDYCYSAMEYIFLSQNPPIIGSDAPSPFAGIHPLCKIKVPKGRLNAYRTATNWSLYADYMEEIV